MSAVRILKKGLALLLALVVPLSLVIIENTADASNDAVDAMVAVDIIDSGGNSSIPTAPSPVSRPLGTSHMSLTEDAKNLWIEFSPFKNVTALGLIPSLSTSPL